MTVKEAIRATINLLNGINVPIGLQQQVAQPMTQAVNNLCEIVFAIEEGEKKQEEEKKAAVTEEDI